MKDFGDNGRIDLREGLGRDPQGLTVQANSPGVVYRDMLILGMLTSEIFRQRPVSFERSMCEPGRSDGFSAPSRSPANLDMRHGPKRLDLYGRR